MNKVWIKRSVILGIFIVAVIFFSVFLNQGNTDMTVEMKKASLPTAGIILDGQRVNAMHGYIAKMEMSTIRDSVTPLGENRELTFEVNRFGEEISRIAYEVRSVDGERLIEDTNVYQYEEMGDRIQATVNLKDLIEADVEYNFVLVLTLSDGRTVYYYTRVIQCEDTKEKEKIQFVLDFHNKTFDKEQAKSLSTYMEPNTEGDNTTFGTVNIHSTIDQLSWGNMKISQIGEPDITICELGSQTASLTVDSYVKVTDGRVTNSYYVHEYFRVRYTTERFYLLSYERTMEEYLPMEKNTFANNKIMLGIQNDNIQMMESDGGSILAFENAGRVFSYNVTENKFAQLFTFFDKDNADARDYYRQSSVKILNVEETGNVTFMVYGYMNRGMHEGEVGVEICYYSSMLNTIEEQIFIPYARSQKILMTDMEKLSYINKNSKLYVMIDGTVFEIDTQEYTYKEVVSGLSEDSFQVSDSGKMIVWQKENLPYKSRTLVMMNLNTEKRTEIAAGEGEYIKPLGFLNEDLIYGTANETDIIENAMGEVVFPMKNIFIESEDGTILKNYHADQIYVTEGKIEENQITLTRVEKTEDMTSYQPVADDQITSNMEENTGVNHLTTAVTNLYETILQIELKGQIDTRTLKFLTPKEVLYEGGRSLTLKQEKIMQRYFVYTGGKIIQICTNEADAIQLAYENMGIVLDHVGNEIYKRAELSTRNQIMAIKEETITDEKNSMAVCLDTILKYEGISRNTEYMLQQGESAGQILSQNMKNVNILNLTGCTMDAMLYYVNKDIPVLAALNDGSAVLLIGFNEQNTVLMDPVTGTVYKKGMNDSRTMFAENGNQFITYVRMQDGAQE